MNWAMVIPEIQLDESAKSSIPDAVAEIPQSEEAPELLPVLISFARYNKKECEIDSMDPKIARKALRAIRDIGTKISSQSDFSASLPNLEVKPVNRGGEYKKLYRGLSDLPDIDLFEAKIDSASSRLFFFLVGNQFYVIAARENHYDTDKVKR